MRRWWRVLLATVVITAGGGCGRTLMPTPNLIAAEEPNPFDAVPADRRSNVVEILYATDRQPTDEAGPGVTYGVLRSKSLAFGRTRVRIGPPDMGWDALVAASRAERRSRSLPVRYLDAEELVRLPKWPWYTNIGDDPTITEEQVRVLEDEAIADIHAHLTEILETTDRDEVFVFVHGFNNTFGYAAESLAQLWHFAGRPGIAILYSWPAARGGLFGYNPDRESSQFTVSHLKHFLAILAACDAVKRVDVISHSRGADVLGEALRELRIHYSAQGKDPAVELKIRHAVFAAADIDLEVSTMRLGGERVGDAAEHMTIYTGAGDA
ncbi:MAG: alpha/beta hydrolase, partial [Planctomycetes bacterium]|nr:alpha/beta hydrolase [Planctomycetota bacterium]